MYLSKGYKGIYDLYFTNPSTGKRSKLSTGKSNLRDAMKYRNDFQIDLLNQSQPKVTNLIQLQEDVLEYVKYNFSLKTLEAYRLSLSNLIRILGNRALGLLGMKDFEKYKNERVSSVSKTTVNIEIRTIKAILNYAVRNGYLKTNPALNVRQFSIPEKEKLAFNSEELKKLLEAIADTLIKKITLFGLYTGCRLSEILHVQGKDLDFGKMILTIRNKVDFKTKTGKIRLIPISEELHSLIGNFKGNSEEDYLFSFDGKNIVSRDFVSHKFKKYLRKAKLPEKYHFHCLRHTFITNLIKNNVSINFVKELAGHSDIQTTMSYVHIGLEDMRKAVNDLKIAI